MLKPYMDDSNAKARLIVYEEPLGKSMANKTVSDNPNDLRNSVYSKAAALERKIQILYYDYAKETDSTPILKFLADSVDFGIINQQGNNIYKIQFKNEGKFPFTLSDITTDCSCIKYYFEETTVKAGKEGEFKILIVPDGRKGKKKQVVTLTLQPFNKKYVLPVGFE
jgi:hypothetical protein